MGKSILYVWAILLLLPFSLHASSHQANKLSKEIGGNIQISLEVKRGDIAERITFSTGSDNFFVSHILKTEPPSFISFSGTIKRKKQGSYYMQFELDEDRPMPSGTTVLDKKVVENIQYRNISIDNGINFQIGEEIEIQKAGEDYIKFSTQTKN